ncbi:MAG TPA: IclR family transcriptional regulator C-terminal domain-containing protein [Ramlibacter sp.]|nr:IclR family transcriptional regulator C-terminal domain-containing protein [Ramlibacter sp.]
MKSTKNPLSAPKLPQVKSIAALQRGLEVLGLIRQGNGLALGQLHVMTDIPKASLLRILKTLEESGWIYRRMSDSLYMPKEQQEARSTDSSPRVRLEEVAISVLRDLKKKMPWPSDLGVRSGAHMRVIQSNRSLFGEDWKRTVIGAQPDMLGSAMGRAYLAFCPDSERKELLGQLIQPGSPVARRREWLERMLEDVRACGYATRDPLYAGPDADHDTHLSAIVVPVRLDGDVVACLSCVWQVGTVQESAVISKGLRLLKDAAKRISSLLSPA